MKVKLTQKFIDKELLCPDGRKQVEFVDTQGMYVLVSAASPGIGTYYLLYKNDAGKTCHKKIARTTHIGIKEARDMARKYKLETLQGRDIQADTKLKRNEITYGEFFEQYYQPNIESRLRNARGYEIQYLKHIKHAIGDYKVSQISKHMIQTFHDNLHQKKVCRKPPRTDISS